jgi:hypothetical protein
MLPHAISLSNLSRLETQESPIEIVRRADLKA